MNNYISDDFKLTAEDQASYQRHGFLHLKKVFSNEFISRLGDETSKAVNQPVGNYGAGFNRLKYGIEQCDELVFGLINEDAFREVMRKLTERIMFYTQGLGFELTPEKDSGFGWHVGTQSFGFQKKEDYGCTLWIPFCEVDPNRQRGGMAYLSKETLSGKFIYDHINLLPDVLNDRESSGEEVSFDDFSQIKNSLLNSDEMKSVLDYHAVEGHFELGDAILFDKEVLHRSVQLEPGPIASRLAFALRFCDADSTYDQYRVEQLEYPRQRFNYDGSTNFNMDIAMPVGQRVINNPMFEDTFKKRLVS